MRQIKQINTDVYKAGIAILTEGKASITVLMGADLKFTKYEYYQFIFGELEKLNVIGPLFSHTHPRKILMSQEEFINQYEPEQPELHVIQNKLKRDFEKIDTMDGVQFEYFCCGLLLQNGFYNVNTTKVSGDQGVDILAEKDGIRYAIQCKCFSSDLGNAPVQQAYTGRVMYNCHVAAVMTNRYFTIGAKELAEKTLVLLWDRDKLSELIHFAKNFGANRQQSDTQKPETTL